MKYLFITFLLLITSLNASTDLPNDIQLKKMIGRMIIIGFENEKVDKDSKIVQEINKYHLGGIILFDRFYNDRERVKNIRSPRQLQELTHNLKELSKKPLLISVDQEGGRVARLKPSYGFSEFPSAKKVSKLSTKQAKSIYEKMAKMLKDEGINTNFAPVVDLSVNPKNTVIVGLERSFGKSSEKVAKYAKVLIDAQKKNNILSVLKHFPGHGSSLGDSHKGFVDITDTWSEKELEPYKTLIKQKSVDMIMTAHVFNKHLDKHYPATLSYNVNTKLLRDKLHFKGVIVSDDMQMKAICAHYSLKETVTLAINAGVDMLLFGNQLSTQSVDELVDVIYIQVKNGAINYKRVIEANQKIETLFEKMKL